MEPTYLSIFLARRDRRHTPSENQRADSTLQFPKKLTQSDQRANLRPLMSRDGQVAAFVRCRMPHRFDNRL
jgi:hypothetical protein